MNTKRIVWAAIGVSLVATNSLISGEYSSGKNVYQDVGVSLLQGSPSKVDVYGGASALYNSNTTQLFNGTSSWMGIFDFGFDFRSATNLSDRGSVYGFGYDGAAYWYEDSAARAGRDALEHRFNGFYGLNGGKTRFRADVDYYRNNGNSIEFATTDREARSAQSHDFQFGATVVRDLDHGSFEVGGGYFMRDFDAGTLLNDQHTYHGDLAWFHSPGYTPKTSYGLGFRFGSDDFTRNFNQDFYAPSFRWRYQASAKTRAYGSVGWENRSRSNGVGGSVDNFIFDLGVNWRASDKTDLDMFFARTIRPSYNGPFQDFRSNGFTIRLNHDLPGQFVLTADVGYENADYFSTAVVANPLALREDDFLRAGVSVSHPVQLCQDVVGSLSVFYRYNENDSTFLLQNYNQSVAGVRIGFVY